MVEDVEELGSKLEARAFRERDAFPDAEVHLPGARPGSDIARSIAECAVSRSRKSGRIDPLADGRASRRGKRNARHEIGSLIGGVGVGNRRRWTGGEDI